MTRRPRVKKYKIKYGEHTVALPADIIRHLAEADADELKALILIAAAGDEAPDIEAAGMSEKEFDAAASFLRGAGLITAGARGSSAKKPTPEIEPKKKPAKRNVKVVRREVNPEYTASEVTDMMRENRMLASLIDACQQTLGKLFNPAENNVIITLKNELGLDGEYILLLLAYCAEKDKKNLTYIQRMAADLVEKGVLTPPQLEEELMRRDEVKSGEGALRKMFGMGARALTKKESEIFTLWICDRKHSLELIKEAYERTVAKAGKASVPYCNSILEDWYANGIKTPEDVKAAAEGKKNAAQVRGSFETDDFFGAALNRSMAGIGEK